MKSIMHSIPTKYRGGFVFYVREPNEIWDTILDLGIRFPSDEPALIETLKALCSLMQYRGYTRRDAFVALHQINKYYCNSKLPLSCVTEIVYTQYNTKCRYGLLSLVRSGAFDVRNLEPCLGKYADRYQELKETKELARRTRRNQKEKELRNRMLIDYHKHLEKSRKGFRFKVADLRRRVERKLGYAVSDKVFGRTLRDLFVIRKNLRKIRGYYYIYITRSLRQRLAGKTKSRGATNSQGIVPITITLDNNNIRRKVNNNSVYVNGHKKNTEGNAEHRRRKQRLIEIVKVVLLAVYSLTLGSTLLNWPNYPTLKFPTSHWQSKNVILEFRRFSNFRNFSKNPNPCDKGGLLVSREVIEKIR